MLVHNFVSVILNVVPLGLSTTAGLPPWAVISSPVALLVNAKFSEQVRIKDTLQLINSKSSFL